MKHLYLFIGLAALALHAVAAELKADKELYYRAMSGEAAAQEALSTVILSGRFTPGRPASRQDNAMKMLYMAALQEHPRARQRVGLAVGGGKLGMAKSVPAAACWQGKKPAVDCAALTAFTRPNARPLCDELALGGKKSRIAAYSGSAAARLCIANGTPAMLVPGGPPGLEVEIRIAEFAKHGVEWIVTGDVVETDFEVFRKQFNDVMGVELTRTLGADSYHQIEARVQAKYREEMRKRGQQKNM